MSDYESTARELWSSWYQQDYRPLIDSVKESIKNHIKIFKEENPNNEVYGYSIYTCNGFPHFGPVLNTIEELEDKESDPYYKYCPDEWSDWNDYSCFKTTMNLIESLHRGFDDCENQFESMYEEGDWPVNEESESYWEQNVEKIYRAVLLALIELNSEGEFDWLETQNKLVLIWYSDPSDWEFSMAQSSIKALVGDEKAAEFYKALR